MKKLLWWLLAMPFFAHAEWGEFEFEFEQDKPWVEIAAHLPTYPAAANLIPFEVSSATRNRHFIDAASISVGKDSVIRYTVVIEAAGGARNVVFEGLRCATGERRLYAYGHPDGSWSKARNAGWEPIRVHSLLSYRKALFEDYFCPDGIAVYSAEQAVKRLKQGQP